MISLGAQNGDPKVVVPVEFGERVRKLLHHFGSERISFGGIVDHNFEDSAIDFVSHFSDLFRLTHGGHLSFILKLTIAAR